MSTIPATRPAFIREVLAMARAHRPRVEVNPLDSDSLNVNGHRVDIESLWRIASASGTGWRDALEATLSVTLDSLLSQRVPDSWAQARGALMPRIYSREFLDRFAEVPYTPLLDLTVNAFVIDAPEVTTTVNSHHLWQWRVDVEEIERVALENLLRAAPTNPFSQRVSNGIASVHATWNSGYDSSMLLLPDLHSRLRPILGREFVVAIPSRDSFCAFPILSRAQLSHAAKLSLQAFRKLPYPITPGPFLVAADGIASADHLIEDGKAPAAEATP